MMKIGRISNTRQGERRSQRMSKGANGRRRKMRIIKNKEEF